MINFQNVFEFFCQFSDQPSDSSEKYAKFINTAISDVEKKIKPDFTLDETDAVRLEMAAAAYAYYLYYMAYENSFSSFSSGDFSVSGLSSDRVLQVRDTYLAMCSDILCDRGDFLFEQVKK